MMPVFVVASQILLGGCNPGSELSSQAQPTIQKNSKRPIAVDVEIAKIGTLESATQYIGTTAPIREVSIRTRTEGQLISLNVNIGDPVRKGQIIGKQDDAILVANVLQAEAELAARESEVARAKSLVSNAKTQVERSRLELQQAQTDAQRLGYLAKEGAISRQAAEQAQTNANTAIQALQSAQQQVRSQENEVVSAQKRVHAQIAVINQAKERLSYTTLIASTNGVVLQKVSEAGNLLQPGNEVLRVGDFSNVKVLVEVSELERSQISQGQTATVILDAFPNQPITGKVLRISPAADATSRLIPVEVSIPNKKNQIGSGLLARISFSPNSRQTVNQSIIAPDTALRVSGKVKSDQMFVITGSGKDLKATARAVKIGDKIDGKVSILSGLSQGDRFITRSNRPIKDGDKVVLSALSER